MIEILILITFLGLALSCLPGLGLGNPFQIYFLVWFMVFLGYRLTQSSWIVPSPQFLFALITVSAVWLVALMVFAPYMRRAKIKSPFNVVNINTNIIFFFQILSILILPLTYLKAMKLSGGESVFTILGFMRLRLAISDEGTGYGWLAYFSNMSYVVSSISVILFKYRKMNLFRLMISLMVSLSYAYLSTGRTFILLFFMLHLLPLVLMKQIKFKGLLVGTGALVMGIIFIATMTSKGISSEKGLSDNTSGFTENLRGYTIAPLLACSGLVEKQPPPTFGINTFRTFTAILHTAGFAEAPPALIRDYAHVPDATNVYTVYEIYFKDFGYFGFGFVALLSIFYFYLYRQMKIYGGIYLFLYSAACYPLAMQFFQDQYFSLFSTWVQFFILYWIIFNIKGVRFNLINNEIKP